MSLPKTHTYTLTPCFGCTYSTCRHKHTHTHTHTYTHTSHIRHTHRHTNTHTHHTCRNTHRHTHANTHTHTRKHTHHTCRHTQPTHNGRQTFSLCLQWENGCRQQRRWSSAGSWPGRQAGIVDLEVTLSLLIKEPQKTTFSICSLSSRLLKSYYNAGDTLEAEGTPKSVYGLCTWRAKIAPFW